MKSLLSRRNLLKLGALSLVSSSLPLNFGTKIFAAATHTPFKPVRFAVLSDLHVDMRGENDIKMSAVSAECLSSTVADVNQEEDLAFVLVPGDLLLDGELENAQVVRDSLGKLTVPYYVVAGNHDYIPAEPKKRRKGFHYLTIEEFVSFFNGHGYDKSGRRYYAHQITPGLRIIGLDTCLPLEIGKWGGAIPQAQLKWLDEQLTDHADALNLIFMHHNVTRWSADELPGGLRQSFCIDNDVEVKELLSRHAHTSPVIISGHRHIGMHLAESSKVNYFTVPSLNSHPMRYAVFSLSNQSVSWKTPMVSVAESVHLEARENLLDATWWRGTQFAERNAANDAEVLEFYEHNSMIFGTRNIERK